MIKSRPSVLCAALTLFLWGLPLLLLFGVAVWVLDGAGSIGTRTDIQQANGFLLAQESVVDRKGDG
jgi:hypothetical protein